MKSNKTKGEVGNMNRNFRDGYEIETKRRSEGRGSNPKALKQGIEDCRVMGWDKLESYFAGKLAVFNETEVVS